MDKINVLLTSAGSAGHGSSIAKALLCSTLDLNLVGADMSPRMLKASPIKEKLVIPGAGDERYTDELKRVIKKYSIHCLFSGSEQELVKLSAVREEIEAAGARIFLNTPEVIDLCKNKLKCNLVLESLGFSPPRTVKLACVEDTDKVDFFPAVIKPYLETGASANIFIAKNRPDLQFFTRYLIERNIDIIAQEYIPFDNNEFTVGVTTLLEGPKVMGSIALRKFMEGMTRMYASDNVIISSGITQGEFLPFPEVCSGCEAIARKIKSMGPLNIQLRYLDGVIRPFEINPRFSGTTSARAFNGYNEPEFFIRKYILKDPNAGQSIETGNTGYIVKGLDEQYFSHEN